ncbi:MAG: hypothetical protein R3D67_10535 [Hyphomicrobiaceae bacterium]
MTNSELETFRERLEHLRRDIDGKRHHFESGGAGVDGNAQQWQRISASHEDLLARVDRLPAGAGLWATVKYELIRDFDAVCEDFRRLMYRLDAEENASARAMPALARKSPQA